MSEQLVINFDTSPAAVHGWKVLRHTRAGLYPWDPRYFYKRPANYTKPHRRVMKREVHKIFQRTQRVGANFVDFVLEHPDLLPSKQNCKDPRDEWRGVGIIYWCLGTEYWGPHARGKYCRYVRGVYYDDELSAWQEATRIAAGTYGGMDRVLTFWV